MLGRNHRAAKLRIMATKSLVAFLTFLLAFGTTPAQLWAEGVEGLVQAAQSAASGAEQAAADKEPAAQEGDSAGQAEASVAQDGDSAAEDDAEDGAQGAGDASVGLALDSKEPTEDGAADHEKASQADVDSNDTEGAAESKGIQLSASPQATEDKPVQAQTNPEQLSGNAEAKAEVKSLSSNAKVYIQDSKDKTSSWSYLSGTLSAGTTLWANMFDGASSYSQSVVPNGGTWTYQWMRASEKSTDVSAYTPIEGATSQSLTVTDALAGSYLIVKVTTDEGAEFYGPAVSYGTGINGNYIPGPVLAAGQAELDSVKLDKTAPSVGDVITATAYQDYSTPVDASVNVAFTWSYADSKYGDFTVIDGQTGASLTVTADLKNKYIKVEATAGVNTESAATSDAVLAKGAVKLSGVEIGEPASLEVGATLTAKAYTGPSWNPTYGTEGVTYTWMVADSTSYGATWEPIADVTAAQLTVTDAYVGKYIRVSAEAGANTVEVSASDAVGPFKLAGQVDISAVSLVNARTDASIFAVGDTARAKAREKGAASGAFVDAGKLNYQWLSSATKNGEYAKIAGATSEALELDASLEGRYIKCRVSSKIGSSTVENSTGCLVAKAGSIYITEVALDKSGKVNVGSVLTATATATQGDVTNESAVTWQWYYGDSSNETDTKIEGATGSTLTLTDDLVGKWVEARADGGYGEEDSAAVTVVETGSVELYKVEAAGSPRIGSVLTATAYKGNAYTEVDPSDAVRYQWQYADTNTTSDYAFSNIDGATSSTYTVSADTIGKYIRVRATSDGSVVSTYQKSYYGSEAVDPLGPVMLEGAYTLSSVAIEGSPENVVQAGVTLTPRVKVPGSSSYSEDDVPSDARLTFTWYSKGASDDAAWEPIAGDVDAKTGALTVSEALVGHLLKLEVSALDNTVTWTAPYAVCAVGEYELLRGTTTPQAVSSSTKLVTGDTVTAMVQAKRADGSSTNGIDVTKHVDIAWYMADTVDGSWKKIEGIKGASVVLPAETAGKHLKVVATSGSSSVETVFANPVIDGASVEALVQKLDDSGYRPEPVYGKDTNINDLLEAKCVELGFEGVEARVISSNFTNTDPKAAVGISADDATNGAITYFFMDPNEYTGWNIDGLRTAKVAFELSYQGQTVSYEPSKTINVPWDEDKLETLLLQATSQLEIGYVTGDAVDAVTGDLSLPYRTGSSNKFAVTWTSDSENISVNGSGWGDYEGLVTRAATDRDVTLTATVALASGADDVSASQDFALVVKGDPAKVEAAKAELQEKVSAGFTYDNVRYMDTNVIADKQGLTADVQFPTPRDLGIDGADCSVVYTSSTPSLVVSSYRGNVFRPLPGEPTGQTTVTLTVTDKENSEITASATLDYSVAPMEQSALDAEVALMEQAKAGYAAAILNGQKVDAVMGDLQPFQKAYRAGDGSIAWTYDTTETDAMTGGIVPVELPEYDPMGSAGSARLFRSSRPSVVQNENLLVTRPKYNTEVTVTSRLSSESYARYVERYPDNETFAKLANQPVSATFTVRGTTGRDDPDTTTEFTVNAAVTVEKQHPAAGEEAFSTWIAAQDVTVEKNVGTTAWDAFKQLLDANDYTYDMTTGKPGSITAPDGTTLAMKKEASGKDSFWAFYVNGEFAQDYPDAYVLKANDVIELRYLDTSEADQGGDDGAVINPDAERPSWESSWPSFTTSNKPTNAKTPTGDAEGKWTLDLDSTGSDPIYVGSYVYIASGNKLLQIDAATGKVVKRGTLQTNIDSTARMVYVDGIIVVPLHGGRLQALTADVLTTVWVTGELSSDQQSLGTLTVRDGYVYAGTSDGSDSGSTGYLTCVSLADGTVRWSRRAEGGFYWAGSVATGDYLVTGDDKGEVYAYDPVTGKTVGTPLVLDSGIRMTLVSDGTYIYAISTKGILYQLSISTDGDLSIAKQVRFGKKSTSTPAIVNGKLVFGGTANSWKTALFVYDASTLTLEHEITTLTDGNDLPRGSSQSAPLVSVQDGIAYVCFTVNNAPGGVYRYKFGAAAAELIFTPAEGQQDYCMNSIIAGPDGTLYYVNDSGTLFAVGAVGGTIDPDPEPEPSQTAILTVSNAIKGSQSVQQQAFSYTVELRGEGAADVTGAYGDLEFKGGIATFTLVGGQSKKATGLPADLSYIVTQEPVDGFTSNQTAFEGILKADGSFTAAFVNTQVPGTALATLRIVGVDDPDAETPVEERWIPLTQVSFKTDSDTTAWDVFKASLDKAGYTYDAEDSQYGVYLKSITSPDGRTLENTMQAPYNYWSFLINDEYASVGVSGYYLKDGDTVELRYVVADKTPLPEVEVDPDAVGPNWESDWPGYTTAGSATDAKTPTDAVKPSWIADDFDGYPSDPIVVNGRLYLTAGSTLYVRDAATGKTLATAQLAAGTDSIARMVYTDGLIVVPLSGGRLQALTADKLVTKWVTEALEPVIVKSQSGKDLTYDQQALTTLTVRAGYVYFGTAAADWNGTYGGWLACVNLSNGAVAWTRRNTEAGYYWAGAVNVGDYLIIGGDDGALQALDPATGEVKGSCDVGASIRSTVVAQGSTAYVVTNDGVLHRVTVGRDGSLAPSGSVAFGFSSTSTPTIAGGKLIVGGASKESYANPWGGISHYGALFIIDAKTLEVEHVIDSYASGKFMGDIKSAPLVSRQADGVYVYFTVNAAPGGVFRYKLGDARAQLIYVPDKAHQNYSMSSVVCDANGVLYYVNDSGALFALTGASTGDDDLSWKDEAGKDDGGDSESKNENGGGDERGDGGSDGADNGGFKSDGGSNGASDAGTDAGDTSNGGGSVSGETPAGKQSSGDKPTGTVAPSAHPLTDAEKRVAAKADKMRDAEDDAATEEEGATPLAIAESAHNASAREIASNDMSIVALIAGGLGVIGLIAAGLWLAAGKRRGGSDA